MTACSPSMRSTNAIRAKSATSIYSLGNGCGKQRARQTRRGAGGDALGEPHRLERRAQHCHGDRRRRAAQASRAVGPPARYSDRPARYGCFDVLHDQPSGTAFSDALKYAAAARLRARGPRLPDRLTHDTRDFAPRLEILKGLPDFDPPQEDDVAAGRFALLALAGELAARVRPDRPGRKANSRRR